MPLTHEFWADRLGTQRSTVSAIMKKFQTSGWVRQSRGVITITDPAALREVSCECYQMSTTFSCACCRTPPKRIERLYLSLTLSLLHTAGLHQHQVLG
jgi:Mn-dependent DtxR family transcriptional regulator